MIIKKPGSVGYEDAKPLAFHGHMDMVLAKDEGVEHDMLTEGVRLKVEGDFISGTGTALGADNGVGVAFMMAILDSTDLAHPPLEAIITVQEEVGKAGSLNLDVSKVTGRRLLDFNWHDPESTFSGCAGDISAWLTIPLQWGLASTDTRDVQVLIHGLAGGHSEFDIHLQRANAIQLLGRLLQAAADHAPVQLSAASAGVNRRVIPNSAEATVTVPTADAEAVTQALGTISDEYRTSDPGLRVEITPIEAPEEEEVATVASTRSAALALRLLPNGVQSMSLTLHDLVESSNTVALLEVKDGAMRALSTTPSAVTSHKYEVLERVQSLAELLGNGAKVETFADCPEWPYLPDSPLLANAKDAFQAIRGRQPGVEVPHSSLELGIFADKLPGIKMISVGPEAYDVHWPTADLPP